MIIAKFRHETECPSWDQPNFVMRVAQYRQADRRREWERQRERKERKIILFPCRYRWYSVIRRNFVMRPLNSVMRPAEYRQTDKAISSTSEDFILPKSVKHWSVLSQLAEVPNTLASSSRRSLFWKGVASQFLGWNSYTISFALIRFEKVLCIVHLFDEHQAIFCCHSVVQGFRQKRSVLDRRCLTTGLESLNNFLCVGPLTANSCKC